MLPRSRGCHLDRLPCFSNACAIAANCCGVIKNRFIPSPRILLYTIDFIQEKKPCCLRDKGQSGFINILWIKSTILTHPISGYSDTQTWKRDCCVRVLLNVAFIIITWRWGDWRNWQKYHSTMLFFAFGSLLYDVLLYNYPMWEYSSDRILPNHTLSAIALDLIAFPCTVLLYIPHMPKTHLKKTAYILMWGAIYSVLEWIMFCNHLITYHHGWNYWTSSLFDIEIFFILYIHYKKPILAYGLSLVTVVSLSFLFKVPISSMK